MLSRVGGGRGRGRGLRWGREEKVWNKLEGNKVKWSRGRIFKGLVFLQISLPPPFHRFVSLNFQSALHGLKYDRLRFWRKLQRYYFIVCAFLVPARAIDNENKQEFLPFLFVSVSRRSINVQDVSKQVDETRSFCGKVLHETRTSFSAFLVLSFFFPLCRNNFIDDIREYDTRRCKRLENNSLVWLLNSLLLQECVLFNSAETASMGQSSLVCKCISR